MEKPNLLLLDYTKPYEVHTDASDFAIGGVLMQEHPIMYKNQKLNDMERRYNVQDKDMTWVMHYLRVRRHYLLGSKFLMNTDNVATSNFQTLKKFSPKQARWKTSLQNLTVLEYKPGRRTSWPTHLVKRPSWPPFQRHIGSYST
ncbi:hypothetical protein RJ639_021358 [Escallonia herrerae]|uniref:Reverse transcriptase RNase H-like domain-containing protein n=1 Tax=Escallonia herrerae TaxID=1293975 RepID=A0AA88V3W1_9ASTE|nr:hypothetical protein RJ639_021358 [Escallonia herrerae]